MTQVVGYLAALVTFLVADMIWLGLMTPRFYRRDGPKACC